MWDAPGPAAIEGMGQEIRCCPGFSSGCIGSNRSSIVMKGNWRAGAILQFLRVIARATGQDGNSSSEGSHGNIHLIACTPTWAGGGTGRRRF